MSQTLKSALVDARYFGSEFQANPGSEAQCSIRMAFAEEIAREKRHQ